MRNRNYKFISNKIKLYYKSRNCTEKGRRVCTMPANGTKAHPASKDNISNEHAHSRMRVALISGPRRLVVGGASIVGSCFSIWRCRRNWYERGWRLSRIIDQQIAWTNGISAATCITGDLGFGPGSASTWRVSFPWGTADWNGAAGQLRVSDVRLLGYCNAGCLIRGAPHVLEKLGEGSFQPNCSFKAHVIIDVAFPAHAQQALFSSGAPSSYLAMRYVSWVPRTHQQKLANQVQEEEFASIALFACNGTWLSYRTYARSRRFLVRMQYDSCVEVFTFTMVLGAYLRLIFVLGALSAGRLSGGPDPSPPSPPAPAHPPLEATAAERFCTCCCRRDEWARVLQEVLPLPLPCPPA